MINTNLLENLIYYSTKLLCFIPFISVTEYEIYHGLFTSPNPETFALAFYREITNLDQHVNTRRGRKFVDIDPQTDDLDLEARHLLTKLKSSKLPK